MAISRVTRWPRVSEDMRAVVPATGAPHPDDRGIEDRRARRHRSGSPSAAGAATRGYHRRAARTPMGCGTPLPDVAEGVVHRRHIVAARRDRFQGGSTVLAGRSRRPPGGPHHLQWPLGLVGCDLDARAEMLLAPAEQRRP